MAADIAAKGWQPIDLARRVQVAPSTVSRFLNGDQQTARMAKRFARVLGTSVSRYLVTATAADAAVAS